MNKLTIRAEFDPPHPQTDTYDIEAQIDATGDWVGITLPYQPDEEDDDGD